MSRTLYKRVGDRPDYAETIKRFFSSGQGWTVLQVALLVVAIGVGAAGLWVAISARNALTDTAASVSTLEGDVAALETTTVGDYNATIQSLEMELMMQSNKILDLQAMSAEGRVAFSARTTVDDLSSGGALFNLTSGSTTEVRLDTGNFTDAGGSEFITFRESGQYEIGYTCFYDTLDNWAVIPNFVTTANLTNPVTPDFSIPFAAGSVEGTVSTHFLANINVDAGAHFRLFGAAFTPTSDPLICTVTVLEFGPFVEGAAELP